MTAFLNHIGGLTGWGLLAVAPTPTPPHPTQLNFGISYQSMHTVLRKKDVLSLLIDDIFNWNEGN